MKRASVPQNVAEINRKLIRIPNTVSEACAMAAQFGQTAEGDDNKKTLLPPRAHNSKGEVTTNVVTPTTTPRRKNAIGGTQPPLTLTPTNIPATTAGGGTTPRANAH